MASPCSLALSSQLRFRTLLPIPPLNRKGTLLFRAGYSWRLLHNQQRPTPPAAEAGLESMLRWEMHAWSVPCLSQKVCLFCFVVDHRKNHQPNMQTFVGVLCQQGETTKWTHRLFDGPCFKCSPQMHGSLNSDCHYENQLSKPQIETITTITKSTNGYGSKWLNSYWLPFFNQVDPGHKIPTKMTQSPRLVHHFILPISLTTASISSKMPHKPRDKLRFCGDFQCTQRGRCLYTYIYIYQLCACMHAGMHPWMYGGMDVWMYGYLCICMDICGSIYIYIDYICGYVWICMDMYGCVWTCMNVYGRGQELFGNYCFSVLGFFVGSAVPSIFLAICISLELEAGISWSSNLSFSMIFATYFGAQTFHVGWYFATRGHLGFV